jgi:serine/threonine protein kinase
MRMTGTGSGATLSDRYRLEGELGRGGMATVHLAHDLRHQRKVAIKVIHADIAARIGVERFLREIQTIASLQHPHILGLIDSGDVDGAPYYVMPFVTGGSLKHRLENERQIPVAEAVRIAAEVAAAIDYANRHGIVHRDIKPANILLQDGQALVADFGIALAMTDDGSTRMTEAGISLGTPHYMSPEQASGSREITPRSDVYAIGALTYEMLVGEPPFTGPTAQSILARILTEKPAGLSDRRETVPVGVERAVLTALQRLPADRYSSAGEFSSALSNGLSSASATLTSLPVQRTLTSGTYRITEDTCRRLARTAFDPRLVGSTLSYLDNGVASDILVCYIAACGRGGDQYEQVLHESPFRGVAPTFRGFEPATEWRPAFSIDDHIVIIREFLRDLVRKLQPRLTILAGFSSGGDFVLRFVAADDPAARVRVDGCLTLGANLSIDTCFLTSGLASLQHNDDASLLSVLRGVSARAESLDEWVNICEYAVKIVPVFRYDVAPLRAFGAGVSAPFEGDALAPFARWYREASGRGCRLRCVFEDTGMYRNLVRDLQIRNFDEGILGDRYEEQSIIADAGMSHFDLLRPDTVRRHLDALLARIAAGTPAKH